MDQHTAAPRRHQDRAVRDILKDHLPEMSQVLERHRGGSSAPDGEHRSIKRCVAVVVWEEADGTESISVVGDTALGNLALKGLLHDAIYAMAGR